MKFATWRRNHPMATRRRRCAKPAISEIDKKCRFQAFPVGGQASRSRKTVRCRFAGLPGGWTHFPRGRTRFLLVLQAFPVKIPNLRFGVRRSRANYPTSRSGFRRSRSPGRRSRCPGRRSRPAGRRSRSKCQSFPFRERRSRMAGNCSRLVVRRSRNCRRRFFLKIF